MTNGVIGQSCQIMQVETSHGRWTRIKSGLKRARNGVDTSRNVVPMGKWGWVKLTSENRSSHWDGRNKGNEIGWATSPTDE